jgi:hypothetical protein
MAKKSPLNLGSREVLLGLIPLAWYANYMSARYYHWPFLYCWGRKPALALYEPVAELANVAALGYFFVQLVRFNVMGALTGALMVVILMGIPTYAETFFRLGGSCG